MILGNLEIKEKAALAPLAGVADRAFRELCKGYGAAYTVCEMASAKGISLGDKKSAELLSITETERPAGSQIFGNSPETMATAAKKALEFNPDFIDINMGCPAPKVASSGGGALLMKNPLLAADIVKAVVEASTVPVTVKMRSGWDDNNINAVELAKRCEDAGAAAITVHGRTKVQMYAPPVNTDIIKQVKAAVKIPVIGNGDVIDGPSAAKLMEETGCDMVMIGRGALGRPWVFSQINAYLEHEVLLPEPTVTEKMFVMLNHIEKLCEYKGERVGIREARKHAAWYTKGLHGAANYRARIGLINSVEELRQIALELIEQNS
ncbi:MAG: tRNA dihydrouridine synthase DusB [Clostridia bacterium]|nr:tRNA dihydrouridine synthase DusB [Clostridia bacterium]MBQ6837212.1 tRNA dihydrouridine synthase DusB [Clostridia bacterium]